MKEKTLLKPNVFRSTPAEKRGTIVFEPENIKVELNPIVKAHVVSQIVTETVRGACGHRDESNRCASA